MASAYTIRYMKGVQGSRQAGADGLEQGMAVTMNRYAQRLCKSSLFYIFEDLSRNGMGCREFLFLCFWLGVGKAE